MPEIPTSTRKTGDAASPPPDAPSFDAEALELLAAFVEGRLEGEERDAVIARLAEDPDYEELLQEMLEITGEDGDLDPELTAGVPQGPGDIESAQQELKLTAGVHGRHQEPGASRMAEPARVLFGPWRRWQPVVAGLAALAVLAVGLWYVASTAPLRRAEGLVATLDTVAAPEVWSGPGVMRSGDGDRLDFGDRRGAFVLGENLADLHLALEAPGNLETASERLRVIRMLLDKNLFLSTIDLEPFRQLESVLEGVGEGEDSPVAARSLFRDALRAVMTTETGYEFWIEFGLWSRSCDLLFHLSEPARPASEFPQTQLADFVETWRRGAHAQELEKIAQAMDQDDYQEVVNLCRRARPPRADF